MAKKLRNLALLGGLGAAAYMMGKRSGESETAARKPAPVEDATKRRKAVDAVMDKAKEDTTPKATPTPKTPKKDEGVTASGLPREARNVRKDEGETASGMPREARDVRAPTRSKEVPPPMTQKDEGVTASGLPREARGVADNRTYREKWVDKQNRAGAAMGAARRAQMGFKKGGMVSASKRADGIAVRGKTRCKVM